MFKFHWTPAQWAEMPTAEKAIVMACIDVYAAEQEKQRKEQERAAAAKRR